MKKFRINPKFKKICWVSTGEAFKNKERIEIITGD